MTTVEGLVSCATPDRLTFGDANSRGLSRRKLPRKSLEVSGAQKIYNCAVEKSGVRRKGGIHVLRHYPGFRTISGNSPPGSVFKGSGKRYSA